MVTSRYPLIAFNFLFVLNLMFGCQELRTTRNSRASQVGQVMASASSYNTDEFNLAYTTCLSLRAKSSALRAEFVGSIFHFELEHTGCTGEKAVTMLRTTLTASGGSDGPLLFIGGPEGGYFDQVTTHAHGQLAPICKLVLEGQVPNNTYQNGADMLQVRFISTEIPKVIVYTANEKNGEQLVVREDQYVFQLSNALTANIQGLEQEHKQLIACPNGAKETLRQLFLHNSPY